MNSNRRRDKGQAEYLRERELGIDRQEPPRICRWFLLPSKRRVVLTWYLLYNLWNAGKNAAEELQNYLTDASNMQGGHAEKVHPGEHRAGG